LRAQDEFSPCADIDKFLSDSDLNCLVGKFREHKINREALNHVTQEGFESMGLTSAEIDIIIASRSVSSHLMLDEMHA
jgi:hypothetical protein